MLISKSSPVNEIISFSRGLESVLERFGFEKAELNKQLEELCLQKGTNPDFVVEVIKAFCDHYPFPAKKLSTFPLPLILDYLRKTHRYYLDKKIPELELSFIALGRDYSFTHPQLLVLAGLFMDYKKELVEHIDLEEFILFPFIEELVKVKQGKKNFRGRGLDKYSIDAFCHEHHHEEEILTGIRRSIEVRFRKQKTPLPFRIFLNQIECFEKDLLCHSRIEDEVLFPLASMLEKELKGQE